jgi:hypothetical protein
VTLELPDSEEYHPFCFLRAGPFLVMGTNGGFVCFFNREGKRLGSFQPYLHPVNVYHNQENLVMVPTEGEVISVWPLSSLKLV